ncbi:MAG: zinc ribbon domain-containing protein [Planctomycetales bacterium]|nr:zinc ribbon domain-containing protein [Planctomycetales bacterium]
MPLYEYECAECESNVELLVRSQDEQVECPKCGNKKLTRLMSAPAAPNMKGNGSSLPVAARGESCGAPRCCGGICN